MNYRKRLKYRRHIATRPTERQGVCEGRRPDPRMVLRRPCSLEMGISKVSFESVCIQIFL